MNDTNVNWLFLNDSNLTADTTDSIDIPSPETTYFDENEGFSEGTFIAFIMIIIGLCFGCIVYAQYTFDASKKESTKRRTSDYPGKWILYHQILAVLSGILLILSIIFAAIDGFFGYFILFSLLCMWMIGSLMILRCGVVGEAQAIALFWPIAVAAVLIILVGAMGGGGGGGCNCNCNCQCCDCLERCLFEPWCECCKEY